MQVLTVTKNRAQTGLFLLAILSTLGAVDAARAGTLVKFDTNMGSVNVDLFDNLAPQSTGNFLNYVTHSLYNDTVIHSATKNDLVQGGGYTHSTLERISAFASVANDPVKHSNTRGTIAMTPFTDSFGSSTSQWFFNLANNTNFDTANGVGLTVFGWVVGDGMSTLDAISNLKLLQNFQTFNSTGDVLTNFPVNGSSFVVINSISVVSHHPDFQNPVQVLDVNNDATVSPLDALVIINDLIANGIHQVGFPYAGTSYLDVNGDNKVTPLDALQVINSFLTPAPALQASAMENVATLLVPEPSAWTLAATGLVLFGLATWRRKSRRPAAG